MTDTSAESLSRATKSFVIGASAKRSALRPAHQAQDLPFGEAECARGLELQARHRLECVRGKSRPRRRRSSARAPGPRRETPAAAPRLPAHSRLTNSCNSSGVPRITSTYTVVATRYHTGPYTRPDASASPTMTASAIDNIDTRSVTTAARASEGRIGEGLSGPCRPVPPLPPLPRRRRMRYAIEQRALALVHTPQRRKICSSVPSRIAWRSTASTESRRARIGAPLRTPRNDRGRPVPQDHEARSRGRRNARWRDDVVQPTPHPHGLRLDRR